MASWLILWFPLAFGAISLKNKQTQWHINKNKISRFTKNIVVIVMLRFSLTSETISDYGSVTVVTWALTPAILSLSIPLSVTSVRPGSRQSSSGYSLANRRVYSCIFHYRKMGLGAPFITYLKSYWKHCLCRIWADKNMIRHPRALSNKNCTMYWYLVPHNNIGTSRRQYWENPSLCSNTCKVTSWKNSCSMNIINFLKNEMMKKEET